MIAQGLAQTDQLKYIFRGVKGGLLVAVGGKVAGNHLAKLAQRHIVDDEEKLTPPWLEYDKLRTGTVVLMRISLRTYSIPQSYTQKRLVTHAAPYSAELIPPLSFIKFTPTESKCSCDQTSPSTIALYDHLLVTPQVMRGRMPTATTIA
jgi:hypothetical protein